MAFLLRVSAPSGLQSQQKQRRREGNGDWGRTNRKAHEILSLKTYINLIIARAKDLCSN